MSLPLTSSTDPIIIIGSGLAAYSLAKEFRKINAIQPITLVTADSGDFYSKPMLSNAFASKKNVADLISNTKEAMVKQLQINILSSTHVEAVDGTQKIIKTNRGDLTYQDLVFAVGANPIHLNISGNASSEILSVNDLNDYSIFQEKVKSKRKVLILGAGLIGSEFANDLALGGYEVHVVDLSPHPLSRLLPQEAGAFFQKKLSQAGIKWSLGTSINDLSRDSSDKLIATLENGEIIEADVVLSAIGLKPRVDLAAKSNITVNRGIVVDRYLQTNIDHIYALGDCAEVDGLFLPYVMPIMHAARALSQTLNGSQTQVSYPAMPVVVKTPAITTVVAPLPLNTQGVWSLTQLDDGIDARCHDDKGRLIGFALLGKPTSLKGQLIKELPAYHS